MILIFELMDEAVTHAPGNSQWTQVIARAAPHQQVRLFAPPVHRAALAEDPNLLALPNLELREIPLLSVYRRQVNVASPRRFGEELTILRAALADVPPGEPCLVVFASAAPTAVFAALLAGRLMRRRVQLQMVLHGFANAVQGWRTRNPVLRRFDLRGLMQRPPRSLRFLALEPSIAAELGRIVPASAGRIDVLPLPVNAAEIGMWRPVPLDRPLKVALVGQTTAPKGIGPFLETARRFKQRYGAAIEFHVIGRRFPDTDPTTLAVLDSEVTDRYLDRAVFLERLAGMHYVFLPLHESYYRLSPSGALIDAITWLKPVIATAIPVVADAFRAGGDIGELCQDVPAMQTALERIMERPDPERYARQVEALKRLRAQRTPESLVSAYRDILERGFGDLLAASFR
jgi:glycosyltransferase involved in cell wall biosynthesis